MLRVVAVRHAKPVEDPSLSDEERSLSEEGKIVQKKMAEELKKLGIHPTEMWSSPLLRAKQTAEIIGEVFGVDYETESSLGTAFNEHELMVRLQSCKPNSTIVLVGHAPTLADFCNEMIGDELLADGIAKSGAAIVEFSDKVAFGLGKLLNYIHP